MNEKDTGDEQLRVNPGYAAFQIAKALTASEEHEDSTVRANAQRKVAKWLTVLRGVLVGTTTDSTTRR